MYKVIDVRISPSPAGKAEIHLIVAATTHSKEVSPAWMGGPASNIACHSKSLNSGFRL
jgi:hypothetical protein